MLHMQAEVSISLILVGLIWLARLAYALLRNRSGEVNPPEKIEPEAPVEVRLIAFSTEPIDQVDYEYTPFLHALMDGYSWRVISKAEIVSWADAWILKLESPPYFLIQLSMGGEGAEMSTILEDVLEPNQPPDDKAFILGAFCTLNHLTFNPRVFYSVGTGLHWEMNDRLSDRGLACPAFDAVVHHAFDGDYLIDHDAVVDTPVWKEWHAETPKVLEPFRPFTLKNYRNWEVEAAKIIAPAAERLKG